MVVNALQWQKEQMQDQQMGAMIRWQRDETLPTDVSLKEWVLLREDKFVFENGLLFWLTVDGSGCQSGSPLRLAVPAQRRMAVLRACHDAPATGGHMGRDKTFNRICKYFWWPRLYTDTQRYVDACLQCTQTKRKGASKTTIDGQVVAGRPWECIAMDLLAMPLSQEGNKYVLAIMDYFSRYAVCVPVVDKTQEGIAQAITKFIFLQYGPAEKLLSDRGTEFENQIVRELCETLGVKRLLTSPYHPEGDGLVERFNRTLLGLLRAYMGKSQEEWEKFLPVRIQHVGCESAWQNTIFNRVRKGSTLSYISRSVGERIGI